MFSMWARAQLARVAALAVAAPLLFAGVAPASAEHPITPAFGSDSQIDYIDDFQSDTNKLPMLKYLHSIPIDCFNTDTIQPAYDIPITNNPTINKTNHTIVIINTFKNPNIQINLTHFDNF